MGGGTRCSSGQAGRWVVGDGGGTLALWWGGQHDLTAASSSGHALLDRPGQARVMAFGSYIIYNLLQDQDSAAPYMSRGSTRDLYIYIYIYT